MKTKKEKMTQEEKITQILDILYLMTLRFEKIEKKLLKVLSKDKGL